MADDQSNQLSLVGAASSNFNSIIDGGARYLQQLEGEVPLDDSEFRVVLPKYSEHSRQMLHDLVARLPKPHMVLRDFDLVPWKMSLLQSTARSEPQCVSDDFLLRLDMVVALHTGVSCVKLIDKESEADQQLVVSRFQVFRNAVQAVFPSATWPARLVFMHTERACTDADTETVSYVNASDKHSLERVILQGESKAACAHFRNLCSLLVGLWSAIRTSSRKVVDMYDMAAYTIESLNLSEMTLSELKQKCEEFTNAVCPFWNSAHCQHVYSVPPIFKIEFAEPVGQGSGAIAADATALKKVKGLERYAGDLAEYEVYRSLEYSGSLMKRPFISIHGFKWNETKAEAFQYVLPKTAARKKYFEADVIMVHKQVGVVIMEIKACIDEQQTQNAVLTALREALKTKKDDSSETIRKKYQEAKKQLTTDAEFVEQLAEEIGVKIKPSQMKKVICFPFVSKENLDKFCRLNLKELQQDGFYICTSNNFENFDYWMYNLVLGDGTKDASDLKSLLNNLSSNSSDFESEHLDWFEKLALATNAPVEQDASELYEALAPLLLAISACSTSKQLSGVMQDATKSTAYAGVSTRIKEHKIVEGNVLYSGLVKTKKEARAFHDVNNYVFMLTPDQMAVWKSASNWQIICGAAGTGKTVLTFGKILYLAREKAQQVVALVPFPANKKYKAVLKSANDLVQVYEPNSLPEQLQLLKVCVQGEPGSVSFVMQHLFSKLYASVHSIITERCRSVCETSELESYLPELYDAINCVDYATLMRNFGSQIPKCDELVDEMESFLRGKFLFTDDSLTLTKNNLLFIVAYLIGCVTARNANSIAGCWMSYDPKQTMPRTKGLQSEIAKWAEQVISEIANSAACDDTRLHMLTIIRELYTYATAKMYTAALYFHNLNELTASGKDCFKRIDTVMRCGSNLFRYWYDQCLKLKENRNTFKFSENVWLSSKAYAGHNVTGSEIRSFSVTLDEVLESEEVFNSIEQLTKEQRRDVATCLAGLIYEYVVIIKGRYASRNSSPGQTQESAAASTHAVETAAKLQLKDFVVLLDPDMECLMQDLRDRCARIFKNRLQGSKVSDIAEQLGDGDALNNDCLAIDSVSNCVSLEWPVVFFVSCDLEQNDTENWNVFVDYFALSRAICTQVWIHVC